MQKLIVHNFRQISHAEIEIKEILFLIGEQASGKSTIAKLIYFFKSLKEDYFNLVYENINNTDSNLEELFRHKIQDKFKVYFGYTTELANDFDITFYYNYESPDSTQNRFLRLHKNKALNVTFDYDFFGQFLNNTRQITTEINEFSRSQTTHEGNYKAIERSKSRFVNNLLESVDRLFYDSYEPMFFPAGRNITVSYPEQFQALFLGNLYANNTSAKTVDMLLMKSFILHSKFLIDYFRDTNFGVKANDIPDVSRNIIAFFNNHAEYILKGKYDNSEGNEKIVFNNKKPATPLNIASSGQQESVRIIQDLYYILLENNPSFRVIEEPEAHLYPQAQKKLIELIALITNKTQSQIVITTHSPYILSILNNLLLYSIVSQNNPEANANISTHFGTNNLNIEKQERIHLLSSQIQAYSLDITRNVYCQSIIDAETGLIGENFLDSVTEELNNDFGVLYDLNFQIH